MSMTTPPGWYPDPEDQTAQRYWDGTKWLDIPAPATQSAPQSDPKKKRNLIIALAAGIGLAILLAGGGIAWKVISDNRAAALIAEEEAAAKEAAEAALAEQEAADDREREMRADSVTGIEESVKKMAEEHAADNIIDGPVLEVKCSPVGGGSTDDLDQSTTVFKCFVANEDHGDGTMSGFNYNATMNWETGEYTYGLGAP